VAVAVKFVNKDKTKFETWVMLIAGECVLQAGVEVITILMTIVAVSLSKAQQRKKRETYKAARLSSWQRTHARQNTTPSVRL